MVCVSRLVVASEADCKVIGMPLLALSVSTQARFSSHKLIILGRLDYTETGGGILADEMGMGKSLSMLALILRTIEAAHAWASSANSSSQSARSTWGMKFRSKATLIVASSDCACIMRFRDFY